MVGRKETKEKLNNTLIFIVKLLLDNNIKNWFIGYGTLLGIVRDNNCINNDDDIDIIIDSKYFDIINKILQKNDINITREYGIRNTKKIIKTIPNNNYTSIDFYCANYIDETKSFHDTWENVLWTNCKNSENNFLNKEFNGIILNLPFHYEKKLEGRYGKTWMTPRSNYKGPSPRLRKL